MPDLERNWNSFWKTNRELGNGVYGRANPVLLEHAGIFKKGKSDIEALDVATGDGRYAIPLALMGYNVTAIDKSKEAIGRLRERVTAVNHSLQIHTEEADIFDILMEERDYDLIICSGFIEEIPQSKHDKLILGLQKWTTRSGINILRYVVEKRLSLNTEPEAVADHAHLQNLYGSWKIARSETEANFRQAKVGREINERIVNRFFRAATIVANRM